MFFIKSIKIIHINVLIFLLLQFSFCRFSFPLLFEYFGLFHLVFLLLCIVSYFLVFLCTNNSFHYFLRFCFFVFGRMDLAALSIDCDYLKWWQVAFVFHLILIDGGRIEFAILFSVRGADWDRCVIWELYIVCFQFWVTYRNPEVKLSYTCIVVLGLKPRQKFLLSWYSATVMISCVLVSAIPILLLASVD